MTPTILILIFMAVVFLRHFLVDLPNERKQANKTYLLSRKDISRVVRYGLVVGLLIMSVSNILQRIFGNDSYWFVGVWSVIYVIAEVFYRKVSVPFLNRREVSES